MDTPRVTNLSVYAACALGTVMSAYPDYNVINFGILLIFLILITAYIIRYRAIEDSLVHHHMTFVIRTIWIYSFLYALGSFAAAYLIYQQGDQRAITGMFDQISNGLVPTKSDLRQVEADYLSANGVLIVESILKATFPALLYLIWRVTRGATRAYRNFRVQNIYSWI